MTERIVYRNGEGENKENNEALEQELRNKDELLRMEQEEKKKMEEKLQNLEKMFEKKESVPEENQIEM